MVFVVKKVPATGVLDDGDTIGVLLENEKGERVDIRANIADFEDIINALNEAVNQAFEKRLELGKRTETPINTGAVPTHQLRGYRFLPSFDQSHLLLQIQTPGGRLDIRINRDIAKSLAQDAAANVARLFERRTTH